MINIDRDRTERDYECSDRLRNSRNGSIIFTISWIGLNVNKFKLLLSYLKQRLMERGRSDRSSLFPGDYEMNVNGSLLITCYGGS